MVSAQTRRPTPDSKRNPAGGGVIQNPPGGGVSSFNLKTEIETLGKLTGLRSHRWRQCQDTPARAELMKLF
jgi:hypothetical protein